MHKQGDFNGKWELQNAYKENDSQLMNSTTVAPEVGDSEVDPSGTDDMDEDAKWEEPVKFENGSR
jgi:hypothetical protein